MVMLDLLLAESSVDGSAFSASIPRPLAVLGARVSDKPLCFAYFQLFESMAEQEKPGEERGRRRDRRAGEPAAKKKPDRRSASDGDHPRSEKQIQKEDLEAIAMPPPKADKRREAAE